MTITRFRELHQGETFVMPNPWDRGSAKILYGLGFEALATTSAGHAHTLGRNDGERAVTRAEALRHAAEVVNATSLPVNGDLERGYGDSPEDVALTIQAAIAVGLAGCSIEDATGDPDRPIYDVGLAVERITAAVEACGGTGFVLTARAENLLHGIDDMADTVDRLQRFADAGAEVVYAPGLANIEAVTAVTGSVDCWVNVLARPDLTVAQLAEAGVTRISLGSAMSRAALGSLLEAGREVLSEGTFTFAAEAPGFSRIQALFSKT